MSEIQNIMIIEDEKNLLFFMERTLAKTGYTVFSFENEISALSHLQKNSVDLIILDFHLQKLTGFEVVHQIRETHSGIPIVITSGCFSEEIQRVKDKFSIRFLAKPFTTENLKSIVANKI